MFLGVCVLSCKAFDAVGPDADVGSLAGATLQLGADFGGQSSLKCSVTN